MHRFGETIPMNSPLTPYLTPYCQICSVYIYISLNQICCLLFLRIFFYISAVKFGPGDSKYHSNANFSVADLKNFLAELLPESLYKNFELLRTLAAHEYLRQGDPMNHTFIVEQHMKVCQRWIGILNY